jgi:hypothetical protein
LAIASERKRGVSSTSILARVVRRGHALVFWFPSWDRLGLVGQPGEFGPAVYSSQEARWALEYVGKLNSVWWLCI